MSIRSAEFTPPTLIPNGCPNCGGPCYIHATYSIGLHQVKCGRGLDAACGYRGPFSSDKDEAIRLHNLLCRPNPETQAVALAREHEAGHAAAEQSAVRFLKAHLATLAHTEAVADCLHCSLNYLISRFIDKHRALSVLLESPRSPVDAVPVATLSELEAELRDKMGDYQWAAYLYCADRLAEVIKARGASK